MNVNHAPAMARRARPYRRRGFVRVAVPRVLEPQEQHGEAELEAFEVRIDAEEVAAFDAVTMKTDLRLHLQEEQLLDDLPCPCFIRSGLTSIQKTLYRINIAIQRRNVGLLAFLAEYNDTGKGSLTSMCDWTVKCIPAYPARTRQIPTLGCKSMEFLKVHLRGAFSGGLFQPEPKAVTFMHSTPFGFAPSREPTQQGIKVPTLGGYVYGTIVETPVIFLRLARSQCPACQAVSR